MVSARFVLGSARLGACVSYHFRIRFVLCRCRCGKRTWQVCVIATLCGRCCCGNNNNNNNTNIAELSAACDLDPSSSAASNDMCGCVDGSTHNWNYNQLELHRVMGALLRSSSHRNRHIAIAVARRGGNHRSTFLRRLCSGKFIVSTGGEECVAIVYMCHPSHWQYV